MDEPIRSDRALGGRSAPLTPSPGHVRRCVLATLPAIAAGLVAGCTVSKALESAPGADLSSIKPGATRALVEGVVGQPLREWTTSAGVRYRLYRYDAGIESNAAAAGFVLFMDAITLGLFEVFQAVPAASWGIGEERRQALMAVSYDAEDTVIGMFEDIGEFSELPAGGRPSALPESGGSSRSH